MGLSLGLIGGGGSIPTVPILVYLFSVDAVFATAYSLVHGKFLVIQTSARAMASIFLMPAMAPATMPANVKNEPAASVETPVTA